MDELFLLLLFPCMQHSSILIITSWMAVNSAVVFRSENPRTETSSDIFNCQCNYKQSAPADGINNCCLASADVGATQGCASFGASLLRDAGFGGSAQLGVHIWGSTQSLAAPQFLSLAVAELFPTPGEQLQPKEDRGTDGITEPRVSILHSISMAISCLLPVLLLLGGTGSSAVATGMRLRNQ